MSEYSVTEYLQPTNHSCSFAAVATLLSYYDDKVTPNDILSEISVNKDSEGNDIGAINQNLAVYCLKRGYNVDIYSADFQLLDLSWRAFISARVT